MRIYRFDDTDPYVNLALEEILFRDLETADSDCFLTYVNQPSVITGKNQNIYEETDWLYALEHGILPVRRMSGGGTVFHDVGNLNFSFLTRDHAVAYHFETLLKPIMNYLRELGIEVGLEDTSNLMTGGLKISGNAQAVKNYGVLQHGTLLFDSDLTGLGRSLSRTGTCFHSKAVKSVPRPVVSIRERLREQGRDMTLASFREGLEAHVASGSVPLAEVSDEQRRRARELAENTYRQFEWVFGRSPHFTAETLLEAPGGREPVSAVLRVRSGRVEALERPAGHSEWLSELEQALHGVRVYPSEFRRVMSGYPSGYADYVLHAFFGHKDTSSQP